MSQEAILKILKKYEPLSSRELKEKADISISSIHTSVPKLLRQKLITGHYVKVKGRIPFKVYWLVNGKYDKKIKQSRKSGELDE